LRGNLRFPPTTFALYYDIVDAVLENRLGDAERCLASIVNEKPIQQPLSIVVLDNATLSSDMVERYGRMMDTDPATPHVFAAPSSAADVESCRAILAKSLSLMQRGCRQTYGEFSELVDQIVLCDGTNVATNEAFLAGSTFTLWGALFINPSVERTVRSLVETLAHEASHTLLFGLRVSDGLILNPDEGRFASPLREDPRPMDGVCHATYVSARMHFAMKELLASGLMPASDARFNREAAERDVATFNEGLKTVRKFGRLTPAGQDVMADAEEYMAAQVA
jgi:HEXXH motif-containing protein